MGRCYTDRVQRAIGPASDPRDAQPADRGASPPTAGALPVVAPRVARPGGRTTIAPQPAHAGGGAAPGAVAAWPACCSAWFGHTPHLLLTERCQLEALG